MVVSIFNRIIGSLMTGNEEEKDASNEEAKSPSNEQVANKINIPEDYIPESEPVKSVGGLNLGGNDMGNEIAFSTVFLFLFFPLYFSLSLRFFLYDTFKIFFVCSLLYSLLALWRLRKAYFKKGWVKVFARPNNIVEYSHVSEGGEVVEPSLRVGHLPLMKRNTISDNVPRTITHTKKKFIGILKLIR